MNKRFVLPVTVACLTSILASMVGCQTTSITTATATITQNNTTTQIATTTAIATATVTATAAATTTTATFETATPTATTRVITDMYGRQLTVPTNITRVLATGPVEMELIYMLAPDKLAGLTMSLNGTIPLVLSKYTQLPLVGGWYGTQTGNYETFIAAKPDIILEGSSTSIAERQTKFGSIPVVGVNEGDLMFNYAASIRFLGDLLGVPEQAQALINYYTDAMSYVNGITANIAQSDKVKVYYAEGKDGLSTDPIGSQHTALLAFCGGINVADVQLLPGYGMASVSLEQILLWNPDIIIIGRGSQASLYTTVTTSTLWSKLGAVRSGRVYLRPDNPFSWFDGPPGPGQILGMYWMVHTLYPNQTASLDLKAKIKEFYSKFLHYDLTDAQLASLLVNANPS